MDWRKEENMTREDIIRMAREAGLSNDFGHLGYPYLPELERFAALVAAAERESIAAWVASQRNDVPATGSEISAAIRARGEK